MVPVISQDQGIGSTKIALDLQVPLLVDGGMKRPIEVVERRRLKDRSETLQRGGDLIKALIHIESLCRSPERCGAARGVKRQHAAGGAHTDGDRRGRIGKQGVYQAGGHIVVKQAGAAADDGLARLTRGIGET